MTNYEQLYKLADMKDADCEKHEVDCSDCPWSANIPKTTSFTTTQADYKSDGKLTFCDLIDWGEYEC